MRLFDRRALDSWGSCLANGLCFRKLSVCAWIPNSPLFTSFVLFSSEISMRSVRRSSVSKLTGAAGSIISTGARLIVSFGSWLRQKEVNRDIQNSDSRRR